MANSKPEQDGMSDVSFMSSVGRQSMGSAASSSNILDTDQVTICLTQAAEQVLAALGCSCRQQLLIANTTAFMNLLQLSTAVMTYCSAEVLGCYQYPEAL